MSGEVKSLRESQLSAVVEMLQLERAPRTASSYSDEPVDESVAWKVLVYDKFGCDVIAPLLKVGELRENGVTLYLLLGQERQQIPDAPAVYLLEPTPENIRLLCQDLRNNLYDSYYFNFLSAIPRPLLEELGQAAVEADVAHQVVRVIDQYLNFVTLTPNLFTLNHHDVYFALSNPKNSESEIEALTEKIASGLFSVLVTQKEIPIIRCPRGTNPAEMVAKKLDQKIRNHLSSSRTNLFQEADSANFQRSVLILLDRNFDLGTMLSHSWNYQALVHDILGMNLNKVTIEQQENGAKKKKTYHLDSKDFFWKENAAVQFPTVAENVDIELNKFKEEHERMTKIPTEGDNQLDSSASTAESLQNIVSNIPMMTERKRILDMHMNIATSLLKAIKERQLDFFVQFEDSLAKQNKATVLEAIRSSQKGLPEDKMRLFLAYYISHSDHIDDAECAEYEEALRNAGCSTAALTFLKHLKGAEQMTKSMMGEGLMREGSMMNIRSWVVGNIQQLLRPSQDLAITKITENIMDAKPNTEADQYLFFDPKSGKKTDGTNLPKTKTIFQSATVVVIGGGNFNEYTNLQDYAQRLGKRVTYGSTEILTGKQFLSQLTDLGQAGA